jgi:hypothetical protein
MEWLKDNYEKAILTIAGIALLVSCALIIARALSSSEQFTGRSSPKPPDNAIKPLPTDTLAAASKKRKSPQNWIGHDGSLLVSRPYVLVDGALIDPLEGSSQSPSASLSQEAQMTARRSPSTPRNEADEPDSWKGVR